MAALVVSGGLLLTGCTDSSAEYAEYAEGAANTAEAESASESQIEGSPECLAAIDTLLLVQDDAKDSSAAFSSTLRAAATGPASGFSEVGRLTYAAAADQTAVANAYRVIAPLSVDSYAILVSTAADKLDASSLGLNEFAAAASAYGDRETNLTTMELNRTANLAIDGPLAAAAAVKDATDEVISLNRNVCK